MSSYSLLKNIPFWHKTYCLSTETKYLPAFLPNSVFLSKNNLVCLLSEKLNVSKGTETFFSLHQELKCPLNKLWWEIFNQIQWKKRRDGEEAMTFFVEAHNRVPRHRLWERRRKCLPLIWRESYSFPEFCRLLQFCTSTQTKPYIMIEPETNINNPVPFYPCR